MKASICIAAALCALCSASAQSTTYNLTLTGTSPSVCLELRMLACNCITQLSRSTGLLPTRHVQGYAVCDVEQLDFEVFCTRTSVLSSSISRVHASDKSKFACCPRLASILEVKLAAVVESEITCRRSQLTTHHRPLRRTSLPGHQLQYRQQQHHLPAVC